jgi:nucleoside-triphosphatase THEP1
MENLYGHDGKYLIFFSGQADTLMYNRGMMIETQMERMKMTTTIQPVAGMYIKAVRNDGKVFHGMIQSVRSMPKGTLVVVSSRGESMEPYHVQIDYSSVYLENCSTVELDDFPLE